MAPTEAAVREVGALNIWVQVSVALYFLGIYQGWALACLLSMTSREGATERVRHVAAIAFAVLWPLASLIVIVQGLIPLQRGSGE